MGYVPKSINPEPSFNVPFQLAWAVLFNAMILIKNIKNKKSGPFNSKMVVSMRIFNQKDISKVKQVSGNFSFAHGDPIHIGNPVDIGIKNILNDI